MATAAKQNGKTAADWKKAAVHPVTLPSGFKIEMRIVDLPAMVATGVIPQHLLDVAIDVARQGDSDAKPTRDLMKDQVEFTNLLVMKSVVSPVLEETDLEDLPSEDKELIVAIATRQRDLDAEGSHIGGLDSSEKFRKFRGLTDLIADVEGL